MLGFLFLNFERHKSEKSKHFLFLKLEKFTKTLWLFKRKCIPDSGHSGGYENTVVEQKLKVALDCLNSIPYVNFKPCFKSNMFFKL